MHPNEISLNYDRFGRQIHRPRTLWDKPKRSLPDTEGPSMSDQLDHLFNRLADTQTTEPQLTSICAGWKTAIEQHGQHQSMFTLSFKRSYSDAECIGGLSQWGTMTNREIYGPRWKKNGIGLAGVAVAERHNLSWDFRGRLHFHILINQSAAPIEFEDLQEVAYEKALLLSDQRGWAMTDMNRIDIRPIDNQPRLLGYLMKNQEINGWSAGEGITFWMPGQRIQGFQFQPLSARQLTHMH